MAPQQNSTLIDESCPPSLLNIPEEMNRYSPILPIKNIANSDKNNNGSNDNDNKRNYFNHYQNNNFIHKWNLKDKEQCQYYKKKQYRSDSYRSSHNCRSRSISLYGVNSTVEKGQKEITIFLNDEPRYVSGVTNKTTCNDIIKALIDDEISNGNYEYCQNLKASRDYSDYVITECWRGIERSYDGSMAILPVWKAWSRVHNEIRLCLKHHRDVQDPLIDIKTNTTLSSIRDYICKLFSFGKYKKLKSKSKKSVKSKNSEEENQPVANDIILLHETEKKSVKTDLKKTCAITKRNNSELQARTKADKEKLYKLSETRSSVRKRRSSNSRKIKKCSHDGRRDFSAHNQPTNFLRKRKDSCIRRSVRNKLAQKNIEMNQRFDREYALTKKLTNKCRKYKLQNELYTTGDKDLEMSVGQIQQSIEACAKEIIQTEHELLKVKNEIKQDISIINNLKRLTIDTDVNECGVPIDLKNFYKTQPDTKQSPIATNDKTSDCEQMFFVDNIYEFCDNNASMLV